MSATTSSVTGGEAMCFTSFDSATITTNLWSGQSFNNQLLLFGQWENYPQAQDATIAIATATLAIIIFIGALFGYRVFTHKNKVTITDNAQSNIAPWVKNTVIPTTVLLWQFSIGLVYLTNVLTGFSSTTAEFIFIAGYLSNFLFFAHLLMYLNSAVSWNMFLKYGFVMIIIYLFLQILFATTGNPFIQGLFGLLGLLGTVGNPVVLTLNLVYKTKSFQLILEDCLLFLHIVAFYVAMGMCNYPLVVSVYIPVLASFNLILVLIYSLVLVIRLNPEGQTPALV